MPGYSAPADTIGPASRVTLALVGIVVDAHRAGAIDPPADVPVAVTAGAAGRHRPRPRRRSPSTCPTTSSSRVLAAWTQLFGLVSFELFGQTRNVIEAHADLLDATATAMARLIGLRGDRDQTPMNSPSTS